MDQDFGALFPWLSILAGAIMFHLLPRFSSRDLFFGVTVPERFPDAAEGRSTLRRYRAWVWSQALLTLALVAITPRSYRAGVFVAAMLVQMAGAFVAFGRAHAAVLPHSISQTTIREADLAPRPAWPGGIAAQLGPFVILAASALYLAAHRDQIQSMPKALGPALLGTVVCGSLSIVAFALVRYARLPREANVLKLNILTMLVSSYFMAMVCGALTVTLPFPPLGGSGPLIGVLIIGASLALMIVTAVVIRHALRTGARGSADGGPIGDATPDECWKWGQFYVNPADPALFVPKRIGIGWTLNYGHPWGWPLTILLIVAPLLMALIPVLMPTGAALR